MTHKEFYIWLQGYLHGKLEDKNIDIAPIVEKMNLVKESSKIDISEPFRIPINKGFNSPRSLDIS